MTVRRILFWCHLACGVFAGVVIFIMSITGALLAYEKQLVLWAETRGFDVAAPRSGEPRLPLEALIARAQEAEPTAAFTAITVRAGADMPVALAAGPRTVYLDPSDGRVLGNGSFGVRRFFRLVTASPARPSPASRRSAARCSSTPGSPWRAAASSAGGRADGAHAASSARHKAVRGSRF